MDTDATIRSLPPEPVSRPTEKTVTLRDIAARCGVSVATVSRALRGDSYNQNPRTIERVSAVAREMGYDPGEHDAARTMAFRKTGRKLINNIISVFQPYGTLEGRYYIRLVGSIQRELTAKGFGLLTSGAFLSQQDPGVERGVAFPPAFHRGYIDGAIIIELASSTLIDQLRSLSGFFERPIVALVNPSPKCHSVVSDDHGGGYAAAAHLLDLGHRYLLHGFSQKSLTHQARVSGYRQAYLDRSLDPERFLIYEPSLWDEYIGQPQQLLRKYPDVTGMLAPYDEVGGRLYAAMLKAGLRIPEDYSLIGYDDTHEIFDNRNQNILTTVALPLEEMGVRAAAILIDQITALPTPPETTVLPVKLIVRGSTAPPKRTK